MRRIALLTGITDYPQAPLLGSIDDVMDIAQFLVNHRNFGKTDVIPLTNQRATAESILTYLNMMADILVPGDTGLWCFSGHGIEYPELKTTLQPAILHQGICGYGFDWTLPTMILGSQIRAIIARLKADVNFICVFDACHSGGLDTPDFRVFPSTVKTFPTTQDIQWSIDAHKEVMPTAPVFPLNAAFITACRSNQTASDAYFNERYNGALTHFLLQALQEFPIETTIEKLVAYTNQRLKIQGFAQEAQAEGEQIMNPFILS